MRILKRMLDFIASRMLMVTVACALLIISFYLAMNTANIWVLIDDGLDARASVVLMGEDAGKLTSYFRPEFIAQDPVLQVGTSDTSPYRDYEIRGYDHRVKMISVWSWPWENVARAEVVESIPAIDGTIRSAKREAALGLLYEDGDFQSTLQSRERWNGTFITASGQPEENRLTAYLLRFAKAFPQAANRLFGSVCSEDPARGGVRLAPSARMELETIWANERAKQADAEAKIAALREQLAALK